MRVTELPGSIGLELLEVDLRLINDPAAGWTSRDVDQLREQWAQRHLILVRGPVLTGEQQLAFVARFGPLVAERRPWGYVSNVRPDGIVREGALLFHSDFAFTFAPTTAISLHALDMPAGRAPTRFADAVRAAALLPLALRRRLEEARVLNVYDFSGSDAQRMRERDASAGSPSFAHPVIGRHPRTGEDVVFANRMHSDRILDVSEAESESLLADLFAVLYDPANVMEHHWNVGDLVLWDNVALHHGRPDFPADEARTLQRVTLGDYTPGELVSNLTELLAGRHASPGSGIR
jgi:taurine dioxygenase